MKKTVNIAIVGIGNVGGYLLKQLLKKRKEIQIKTGKKIKIVAISAKNINKKRNFTINKKIFFKNPLKIFSNNIDILFELVGNSDGISKMVVEKALKQKIHVITANKALISKHGEYLSSLAEKNKVNLEFEASVGGGIPVLRTIKEGLATNKINKVVGILNGTSNYILSQMQKTKHSFQDVLKDAQMLGFAEANPKFDLDGSDVLSKIRILSSLSFNTKITKNTCLKNGIENIELKDIELADKLDLRVKLLGITEIINNKIFERVHPCLIKKDNYIANIDGVMNAIILEGDPVGETVLQGEGAGPGATSSALLSDLLSILRGNIKFPFGIPSSKRKNVLSYDQNQNSNSLYLRIEVKDKPGVLSQITKQLAKYHISIERLIQTPDHKRKRASIVIVTHKAKEQNSNKCLKSFKNNKNVLKFPTLIRLF